MGFGKAWSDTPKEVDRFGSIVWFDFELNLVVVIVTEDPQWSNANTSSQPNKAILLERSALQQTIDRAEDTLIVIIPKKAIRRDFKIGKGLAIQWQKDDLRWQKRDPTESILASMLRTFRGEGRDDLCRLIRDNLQDCKVDCP